MNLSLILNSPVPDTKCIPASMMSPSRSASTASSDVTCASPSFPASPQPKLLAVLQVIRKPRTPQRPTLAPANLLPGGKRCVGDLAQRAQKEPVTSIPNDCPFESRVQVSACGLRHYSSIEPSPPAFQSSPSYAALPHSFQCPKCPSNFAKKDLLAKHWKTVHLGHRPYSCSFCSKRFSQRSDQTKHTNAVHFRLRPYECDICHFHFTHRGNLTRHLSVVHKKLKPFQCVECGVSYVEKSNLLKHIRASHATQTC